MNDSKKQVSAGHQSASNEGATADAAPMPVSFRKLGVFTALVIVAALLVGLIPRWTARAKLIKENAELSVNYVHVTHAQPAAKAAALVLPGEVHPYVESPIYARTSGYLKRWLVDIGAEVKQGQLLAEIDAPEVDQQLAQAKAQLVQAEASQVLAKTTAARWQELLKTSSVSEQEVAEKNAELATTTANVEAAKANVHRLEETQSFQRILAPFDGTITARSVDVGQLVNAGASRELFKLAQTGTLRVYVRVPQTSSALVCVGMNAVLKLTEKPGRSFAGKVVRTAGAIDTDSRTLLVELEVNNEKSEILAGAYAQVHFKLSAGAGSLLVPANALLFRAEGPQLGVVGTNGVVDLRSITIGRDYGTLLEVVSGVSANDPIILNPSDSLVTGMVVKIAESASEEKAQ
jgi:RND family efflux transporter MFP subunit